MKESSRFYSSVGLLIVLNAVIKPLWILGIDREVQNTVGIAAYGNYFSLFNLSILFSFLLDWGMTAYFNRELAASKNDVISHAGNFLFIKIIFSLVYAGAVFLFAYFAGIERMDIILGVILIQVFTSLFVFLRAIITAQQWFRTDAWLSILDKTLMILVCGCLLFFPAIAGSMTIERFIWSQTTCTVLAVLVALVILINRGVHFSIKGKAFFKRDLLKSALPYAMILLLMSVHYRADGFLLGRLHAAGDSEAGIYAGAYRLLDAANMVAFLLASFLLPYVARQWSRQLDMSETILNIRHFLLVFAIGIAMIAIFLAPWLQQLLYHHSGISAIKAIQWCLPALVGYALVHIYGTVMTATGHIVTFCWFTLAAVIINITLNLLLIPTMGAIGSCIAALSSQFFCGIATLLFVRNKLGISLHIRSLLVYLLIAGLLAALFYFGIRLEANKWLMITAATLLTLLIMILTGLFSPRKWMNLVKT